MSGKTTRTQPLTHLGDRFANLERHGSGGMAEVYKAQQTNMGNRTVALKLLSADLLKNDPDAEKRFRREAALSAKLEHDHIVTTYDHGVLDGQPYLAFAFIEGESLEDRLKREPTLDAETSVRLLAPIAEALDYAHRQDIVHRDVKPANILIRASDQRPFLIDFGIGYGAFFSRRLTSKGDVWTTVEYMSPEQARADDVDGRSDLYSLGVVLYERLAGRIPFKSENTAVLIENIKNETPQPVRERNPSVPVALARVVERCMAKKPEDRYQSGAALTQALRATLETQASPSLSPAKWAVAFVAILVLVGTGLYAMDLIPISTGDTPPLAPPETTTTTLFGPEHEDNNPEGPEPAVVDSPATAITEPTSTDPTATDQSETGQTETDQTESDQTETGSLSLQDMALNDLMAQARAIYRSGNYEEAIPFFEEAGQRNSAEAQYYLGVIYDEKQGVLRKPEQAIEQYRAAAEQGYAAAQHKLGIKYQRGEDIPSNPDMAISWLQKAADQGHTEAEAGLAGLYENHGRRTSDEKAVILYEKAALKDHITAQYNLSEMLKDGRGVARKDPVAAAAWMLKAAELGDPNAQYEMGRKYFRADGVEQSDEKALEWYSRAAEQGHPKAINAHKIMLERKQ